jgi:hypothetical protein
MTGTGTFFGSHSFFQNITVDPFNTSASNVVTTYHCSVDSTAFAITIGSNANAAYKASVTGNNSDQLLWDVATLPGGLLQYQLNNNDTTNTASDAQIDCRTEAGGGDAYFSSVIGGSLDWNFGISHVDNTFRFGTGGPPSGLAVEGLVAQQIGTHQYVTFPTTSAFFAYVNTTVNNQTGNGAVVTVPFNTTTFNSNYNTGTFTFTAPVAGRYYFTTQVYLTALSSLMTRGTLNLVTTSHSYRLASFNPSTSLDVNTEFSIGGSAFVNMNAADTAIVQLTLSNGAGNTAGIGGVATDIRSFFCGNLEN